MKVILLKQRNRNLAGAPGRSSGQGLVNCELMSLPPPGSSPGEVGSGTHLTLLSGCQTRRVITEQVKFGRGGGWGGEYSGLQLLDPPE